MVVDANNYRVNEQKHNYTFEYLTKGQASKAAIRSITAW